MRYTMTGTEYKRRREKLGTQQDVSDRLGVSRVTVARRETGKMPITTEAALALVSLVGGRRR